MISFNTNTIRLMIDKIGINAGLPAVSDADLAKFVNTMRLSTADDILYSLRIPKEELDQVSEQLKSAATKQQAEEKMQSYLAQVDIGNQYLFAANAVKRGLEFLMRKLNIQNPQLQQEIESLTVADLINAA
jgi:uncharacterized protein (DUF3084 family)